MSEILGSPERQLVNFAIPLSPFSQRRPALDAGLGLAHALRQRISVQKLAFSTSRRAPNVQSVPSGQQRYHQLAQLSSFMISDIERLRMKLSHLGRNIYRRSSNNKQVTPVVVSVDRTKWFDRASIWFSGFAVLISLISIGFQYDRDSWERSRDIEKERSANAESQRQRCMDFASIVVSAVANVASAEDIMETWDRAVGVDPSCAALKGYRAAFAVERATELPAARVEQARNDIRSLPPEVLKEPVIRRAATKIGVVVLNSPEIPTPSASCVSPQPLVRHISVTSERRIAVDADIVPGWNLILESFGNGQQSGGRIRMELDVGNQTYVSASALPAGTRFNFWVSRRNCGSDKIWHEIREGDITERPDRLIEDRPGTTFHAFKLLF